VTDGPSRTSRRRRRALPWFVGGILLLSIGLPTVAAIPLSSLVPEVGYAHPLSTGGNVTVNLTDQPSFTPAFLTFPAGASISVHLVNVGMYNHTFTLSKKPGAKLSPTLTPSGVYDFFNANGTLANVSLAPGAQGWANLTFNSSAGFDSFEFASVVPYQFQAGMWGFLNLSSTTPGLELSENTTNSFAFAPNVLSASPAHYPVVIAVLVSNEGDFAHTFTMGSQSNVTLSVSNYTQYLTQHPPLVNAAVPSSPGGTVWANFTVPAPGVYEYICTVTGHFQNGMFGFLYVGVPVPAPPPVPSTAIVDAWVLAGSAILLGIGIAFTAAAAFAGRFPPRSTPPGHH
jgi:uncharacterized cupredoxin-like copper-binding protein